MSIHIKKIITFSLAISIITISASVVFAYSFKVPYIGIDAGVLYLGNSDTDSAPSPILRTIGTTVPFFYQEVTDNLTFVMKGEMLFWGNYYTFNGTRAVPQEVEAPGEKWNWVLATTIDPRFALEYNFNESITAGLDLGLVLLLRFPIVSSETSGEDSSHILQYFFGMGRFFYPENNLYIIWNVFDNLSLSFNLKATYPIFHLWDKENLPFYDQLIFTGLIGFLIKI